MSLRLPSITVALVALFACSPPPLDFGYPLDQTLRVNHLQAVGTHNSYHLKTTKGVAEWDYSHATLTEQLELQGVRQFELDIHWLPDEGRFAVHHLPDVDQGTTCEYLTECVAELRRWSDAHRGHHPIAVFIEAKDDIDFAEDEKIAPHMDALDAELRAAWPDRRIEPDDLRGTHATLREAVIKDGWPTLGDARGTVIFVLLDRQREPGKPLHDYTHGLTSLNGRAMFATGLESDPFAAVLALDNPVEMKAQIEAAARANFLVRTYPTDRQPDGSFTTTEKDAALSGMSHYISTDYPAAGIVEGYDVAIPGGTPSRCHPLAPEGCTSADIEDAGRLQPR